MPDCVCWNTQHVGLHSGHWGSSYAMDVQACALRPLDWCSAGHEPVPIDTRHRGDGLFHEFFRVSEAGVVQAESPPRYSVPRSSIAKASVSLPGHFEGRTNLPKLGKIDKARVLSHFHRCDRGLNRASLLLRSCDLSRTAAISAETVASPTGFEPVLPP